MSTRKARHKVYPRRIFKFLSIPPLKTLVAVFFIVGFLVSGFFALWVLTIDVPDFNSFETRRVSESSKIYDRTGKVLLFSIQDKIKRTSISFEEIPRNVKNATVAIEDAEFYQHIGVRPVAFLRAIIANVTSGGFSQGGSTITQQVVKNTLLTPEKTISRKLKEWVLAIRLEKILNKEEILAIYLNEAPYGGNVYGVEEASRLFFGKPAKDLDLAESAYLAALPKAPTYYSPYGNHRESLEERKNLVLSRMKDLSYVSEEEYDSAREQKVEFLPQDAFGIKAPHFVTWVKEYLAEKYGEEALTTRGLTVITTLDYELQMKAEEVVVKYSKENEEKFGAKNAGVVAIDPRTGEVLVMVGSRDYFNREAEGNFNVTLSHRQPGSAFKPFVYATAFSKGFTPDTVVFDLKTEFQTTCDVSGKPRHSGVNPKDCYMPNNYDNVFRGPITFRNALAQSVNIPAIKVLYLSGIKNSIATAQKMGIAGLQDQNQYGLTLVLGGGEVSLLDLVSAYGVFANSGVRNQYQRILRVEDKQGNVLEEFSPSGGTEVLSKNVALQITDILSDNKARTPAFGANSFLYFPGKDVAAKTGTTNDYRDAWVVGYTPSFAAGAWVGNNDNSPMEKKVASFIVSPLWNAFMNEVLVDPARGGTFEKPVINYDGLKPIMRGIWRGGESYFIDRISGKLATELTPEETKEELVLTSPHTILRWVDKENPLGPPLLQPESDPQYTLWDTPVLSWVQSQGITERSFDSIPKEYDDVHIAENFPTVTIVFPQNESLLLAENKITVSLYGGGKYPLTRVDFFINGLLVGSSKIPPFSFSFIPKSIEGISVSQNALRVVGYDSVFNKGGAEITFSVAGLH